MEDTMKVLALNSSPRTGGQSKTEFMLNHLVKGLMDAGAEVEIVNLREKTVNNCIGCFTCWTKTPGQCIHKDDMSKELFPKWIDSDLVVYATPLYYHTMNSSMAAFRERTLPAVQPFFEKGLDGKTFHPLRKNIPQAVWISVCGFPEVSEFDALSYYLNQTRHKDENIVAEIYRSAAESMTHPFLKEKAKDVLEATVQAGREIVENMKISPGTMARIRQPIADFEFFSMMGNLFWKTCIAEKVTPKEFEKKHMIPRPDSIESFMKLLPIGINKSAAGTRKVVLQFEFSGDVTDKCCFIIENGHIRAQKEMEPNPDITVMTPFSLWMDIMTRKADGQQMFMEQKYTVTGDLGMMIQLFTRNEKQS
jgi:multimeric flavodoxin WrbA/putative sterol carrier protein